MRRWPLLAPLLLVAAPAAAAPDPAPLSDPELAAITGKFMLPNGAAIAMSVTSDTLVDGRLVLRSVLTVDQAASIRVFAGPADGAAAPVATRPDPAAAGPSGVTVLFDRQSGMRTVTPTYAAPPTVSVGTGSAAGDPGQGLAQLPLTAGGAAVTTPAGLVSLSAAGNTVTLSGDRIDVTHLMGPAIATAIANTASDRTIDTATHIDLDLSRTQPVAAATAALRVSDMALAATRGMIR